MSTSTRVGFGVGPSTVATIATNSVTSAAVGGPIIAGASIADDYVDLYTDAYGSGGSGISGVLVTTAGVG